MGRNERALRWSPISERAEGQAMGEATISRWLAPCSRSVLENKIHDRLRVGEAVWVVIASGLYDDFYFAAQTLVPLF